MQTDEAGFPSVKTLSPAAAVFHSPISVAASFVWAAAILGLVASAGPAALDDLGLARNWALAVSAGVVLLVFVALRRIRLDSPRREL